MFIQRIEPFLRRVRWAISKLDKYMENKSSSRTHARINGFRQL